MKGDPGAGRSGWELFVGLEEEGEGFGGSGGADGFGDFEAACDFVLGVVGKGVGEERIEAFINAGGADDAGSAKEGAEWECEALGGVEEEDGVE
jgi:hypothetical protein